MPGQRRSSSLSITACDRDDPAFTFESISEFNLTDDGDSFFPDLFYHGIFLSYPRTFHHFIRRSDPPFILPVFSKFDPSIHQFLTIMILQRTFVRDKHVISVLPGEQCGTYATFSATQYDKSLAHSF